MRFSTAVSSLLFGLAPLVAHAEPTSDEVEALNLASDQVEALNFTSVARGNLTERKVYPFYIYLESTGQRQKKKPSKIDLHEQGLKVLSIPDPLCGVIEHADLYTLRNDLTKREGGQIRIDGKPTTDLPRKWLGMMEKGDWPSAIEMNAKGKHFTVYHDRGPWDIIDVDDVVHGHCTPHKKGFVCDKKDGAVVFGRAFFACVTSDPQWRARTFNLDPYV